MSHQTGIKANEELLKVFGQANNGKIRAIKISIINEQLACSKVIDGNGKKKWNEEYDIIVKPLIEENIPCYILYRFDEKSSLGYTWLLLDWIPDISTTRQKMLYASTKATLKIEFGTSNIKEQLNATILDEVTLNGYYKYKKQFSGPGPLTNREEEMAELRITDVTTDISTSTRHKTFSGIVCPITDTALLSIKDLYQGLYNYAQYKIDIKEETIHLIKNINITSIQNLSKEIPKDEARYHIFRFDHVHEGDHLKSIIFIYSMPGYVCPVRERMMYSSCKAPFIEKLQSNGIEISKTLEIDDPSEITEQYLQDQLHPKELLHRPQFAKPKGPPNRGAKRLTKSQLPQ